MAVEDLYLLCREYLEACEAALATAPGGPIARTYVSTGPPAWDCEQLTVYAGGPAEAPTAPLSPPLQQGFRDVDTGAVNLVALTAVVLRCVPVIADADEFPDPADLDAAAQVTHGDLWAIWNLVRGRHRARTLFARADGEPREVLYGAAVALNTSGGLAGWLVPLRVALPGYKVA